MARLVFAIHRGGTPPVDDLYVALEWKDGYGPHSKRVTEDLSAAARTAIDSLMAANPTVIRWEVQRIVTVRARVMREGDSAPVNFPLAGANLTNATTAIDWADAYQVSDLTPQNDKYTEIRRLENEIDRLQTRLERLRTS